MSDDVTPRSLEEASLALTNSVYEATRIFEVLEDAGLLIGNGHHIRQAVAASAVELLRERWAATETVVLAEYQRFVESCGGDRDRAVRVLKGEVPPPTGWEDFVAASIARREAAENAR